MLKSNFITDHLGPQNGEELLLCREKIIHPFSSFFFLFKRRQKNSCYCCPFCFPFFRIENLMFHYYLLILFSLSLGFPNNNVLLSSHIYMWPQNFFFLRFLEALDVVVVVLIRRLL